MKGTKYTTAPYPPSMTAPVKSAYTRADCIAEMKRLAVKFPDTFLTRDFFRSNTELPESAWTAHFGKYPEFLRAAGLWETRYRSSVANRIAKRASTDHMKELSDSRFDYAQKYFKDKGGRFQKVIGASDIHDEDADPFYMRCLLHSVKVVQPDLIILNGDIFDFPEVSKYGVDPREYNPVRRIRHGIDNIIKPLREAAPNAQIDFIEGNHEARVLKHLAEADPFMREMLSDFLNINSVGELLKLDEYEINYIARVNLCEFADNSKRIEKVVNKENYKIYWNSFLAHHLPEGRGYKMPGFNGHHHRHFVWTDYSAAYSSYEWHQLGAGCKRLASYADGTKWNNGFLVAHVDTERQRNDFQYIPVNEDFAVVCGELLMRKPEEYYPGLAHQNSDSKTVQKVPGIKKRK